MKNKLHKAVDQPGTRARDEAGILAPLASKVGRAKVVVSEKKKSEAEKEKEEKTGWAENANAEGKSGTSPISYATD